MTKFLKGRTYVVLSKWCYPFGGGEEFLLQTMQWAHRLGMHCYWIAFTNGKNENFTRFETVKMPFGTLINLPGGVDEEVIRDWLYLLSPDIVHHQGHLRETFFNPCNRLRIEFVTGFHFWHGAVILDPNTRNIDILENADKHKTDPEIERLWEEDRCNYYTVTRFVSNCINRITGLRIKDQIFASSSYEKCKINYFKPENNRYVTLINTHQFKGGDLLLKLMEKMKHVSFLGVMTEHESDKLDKALVEEANSRKPDEASCTMMERVNNPTLIYQQTKIIIQPSMVDETFCRTANEAMMNGIPIITSGQGNLKHIVGDGGLIIPVDDVDGWVNAVNRLYTDTEYYQEMSQKSLDAYRNFSERTAEKQFRKVTERVVRKSKEMNIMIFTPWCDQGLGIQSRNYANILKNSDYNVFIFALKPYNKDTCLELQRDPEEWVMEHIYYSGNDRESVKDSEIIGFINKYNIGKCLLPETCWFRVFEVAKLLRKLNVKCYAIPNIEIVRKDEIYKHTYFYKILCNNRLCEKIFNQHGITKTDYIGYGIPTAMVKKNINDLDMMKFLFVGGCNAFSRKHILSICEAFEAAAERCDNIHLTCTIQLTNSLEVDDVEKINYYSKHDKIDIISEHLPYSRIVQYYHESHVSVQVSKHEGLGLGFYEAVNTCTPVISLNTAPHNEIILDSVNGWLVDCFYKPMTDNKDPIFDSAYFNPSLLTSKIVDIATNFKEDYPRLQKRLVRDYNRRLHIGQFRERFLDAIH